MAAQASRVDQAVRHGRAGRAKPRAHRGRARGELENGQLRYIRIGGIEAIRAIAFLVRDENWGTFTPTLENLKIDERADGFTVTYRATCKDAEADARLRRQDQRRERRLADLRGDCRAGDRRGHQPHRLRRPASRRGRCRRSSEDPACRRARGDPKFPETIDPDCPFLDIRALTHEVTPGVWATCRMEGDTFEMEDQRNWTDASYKTYVRPLARPWPYTLPKGVKVEQAVRLSISGQAVAPAAGAAQKPVEIRLGGESGKMPAIGIGVPAEEAESALRSIDLVKTLGPKWLACQVDLRQGHGSEGTRPLPPARRGDGRRNRARDRHQRRHESRR